MTFGAPRMEWNKMDSNHFLKKVATDHIQTYCVLVWTTIYAKFENHKQCIVSQQSQSKVCDVNKPASAATILIGFQIYQNAKLTQHTIEIPCYLLVDSYVYIYIS